jgi:ketosteroid isomerase-like protein
MSQENVEIVRRTYEAANRGDFQSAGLYLHPEIEFHTYAHSPEAGIYRGKEAVREYNEDLFKQFESIQFELDELVDAGDQVVVVSTQHAVPKGSQQEVNVHIAEVWAVRDGLLAERRSYSTKEEALEAAGLRQNVREILSGSSPISVISFPRVTTR